MAQCPNCSKNIAITEEHFGTLYRCEHCNTEFFIGFDGVPENSKEAPVSVVEPVETVLPPDPLTNMSQSIDPLPEVIPTMGEDTPNLYSIEPSEQHFSTPHMDADSTESTLQTQSPQANNSFQNFADDVQSFGNDVASAGILSFDVEISGIDLGEMKQDLLEALDDKRFGWNLEELNQRIKDGKLTLENISAPKIIVLVKRVAPIGLIVNWRHHVSTQ